MNLAGESIKIGDIMVNRKFGVKGIMEIVKQKKTPQSSKISGISLLRKGYGRG